MKFLVVEDEPNKERIIAAFIKESFEHSEIQVARSVTSAKIELRHNPYDYVILDMSLPLYDNDNINYIDRNEFETFGGIDVLGEIDRCHMSSKVIVVTAFDILGDGDKSIDLSKVESQLFEEYPENFLGSIFYNTVSSDWQIELLNLIKTEI